MRGCERQEERGKVPGCVGLALCIAALRDRLNDTHRPIDRASLITQTHHLYGAARQISKLRRRASSGGLSLGAGNRLFMRAYARPDDRPTTSLHINQHTFEYVQTNRKEGRKSGYHESSSKRARLPPSTVHFLPERHTESSTYRRISGREEG